MGRRRKSKKTYPPHMQEKAGRFFYVISSGEFANKPRWIPLRTGDYSEALERWASVEIMVQQNSAFDLSRIDLGSRTKMTFGTLCVEFFAEGENDRNAARSKRKGREKAHDDDDDEERKFWRPSTLRNYLRMAEELKKYFGTNTLLHKISRPMILRYRRKLRSKPYESNRRIGLLRNIMQQAVDHGYINTNPADRIKKYAEKKHTLRLTEEILFKKIYPASEPMLRRAIMLAWNLVQHENEVKRLKWTDFDLKKNIVSFNRKKTGEPIVINFSTNGTLISFFGHLRSDKRELSPYIICHVSPKGWAPYEHFRSMWNKALEDAGFAKGEFKFKEIRHLANTCMKNANVVVEKRRAMTGHRSNEANEVYTHPSGDDTLEAGRALSEFGPDEF